MSAMFWIWIGVIVLSVILEAVSMELISIWFTFGAVIPLILSAIDGIGPEIQIIVFILVSAILIISLRKVTKKFLLRNANFKSNSESLIGKEFKMLTDTDFDTVGSLKVNDVVWNAVGDKKQTIKKDTIVEVVAIEGNKLIVKEKINENK